MILEVDDLWFRYRPGAPWTNCGASLALPRGRIACLLGPNGAGKTTLVRQIVGMLKPDKGGLRIAGVDVLRDPSAVARHCAYLPQGLFPFAELRPREALHYVGALRGLRGAELARAVEDSLDNWDLRRCAGRLIGWLSGGERRLVGVAAALLGRRELLILDEPTNDLAPEMRSRLWQRLNALCADGVSVLLVTHNVKETQNVISQVSMMLDGKIVLDVDLSQRTDKGACTLAVPAAVSGYLRGFPGADEIAPERWTVPVERLLALYAGVEKTFGAQVLARLRLQDETIEDLYLRRIGPRHG